LHPHHWKLFVTAVKRNKPQLQLAVSGMHTAEVIKYAKNEDGAAAGDGSLRTTQTLS